MQLFFLTKLKDSLKQEMHVNENFATILKLEAHFD